MVNESDQHRFDLADRTDRYKVGNRIYNNDLWVVFNYSFMDLNQVHFQSMYGWS